MKLVYIVAGLLLAVGSSVSLPAQQTGANPWAGEWGKLQPTPGDRFWYEGRRISVTNCTGGQCSVSMLMHAPTGGPHCEASGKLQVKNAMQAEAVFTISSTDSCSLPLEISNTGEPVISVKSESGRCSYFCTPGGHFTGTYPLRSRTRYFGDHIDACYARDTPAQKALCADPQLADMESRWHLLVWEVSDLGPKLDPDARLQGFLDKCDTAAQPGDCLSQALQQSTKELNAHKAAWYAEVTEPGNPTEARQKITAMTGLYRRSFQNGDVQGDTFRSTDRLRIRRNSETSIRYSLFLNFYNGHECTRSGIASYKRGGMFVDQVKDTASGKMCVFEINSTATGIQLLDPTGICRETDCGARGGYNGAFFSFKEKARAKEKVRPAASGR